MKPADSNREQRSRFTLWQLISYGFLTAPLAMGGFALVMFVPTFYAVDLGLGLGLVGGIFVAGRLFDVITDPVIGHMSDETCSRFGPRKPWMMVGVPGFALAVFLLLMPPEGAGLGYLLMASALYFLFYTVLDVPYSSVGLEVSPHVHERSVLASSKAAFQIIGALTVALVPFALALPVAPSLSLVAKLVLITSLVGLVLFLRFVPVRTRAVTAGKAGFVASLKTIWASAPYRLLILCFLIVQAANALSAGLMVLFVTHVIKAPQMIGLFMGLLLLSTALFLPFWVMLSKWRSKRFAWQASILLCCVNLLAVLFLGEGSIMGAALVSMLLGACFGCDAIMPTSVLADIVYTGEQEGKNRLGGLFLALKNSVSKLAFVVPMGLAFPVLEAVGFNKSGDNSSFQLMTLVFFYALLPLGLRLVACLLLSRLPLVAENGRERTSTRSAVEAA
ncbi:MFS transporter [Kordiimonas aestuarii]|uniref:MFS transporter n=1 Tax=Kordiimonas aestuarii TaxID=1005925 RepID=UPI0021D04E19|nr:MFS transporter [Kordiimonas aestuarii]